MERGSIICRICKKKATVPLETEWAKKYFEKNNPRGIFACEICSFEYQDRLIRIGELDLKEKWNSGIRSEYKRLKKQFRYEKKN